ncbi:MAG: RNB domain-containing ribonuclease, partial [Thermodesulfobacteriota bacterium]|nr:RNB domain-containing ribonuclease [Thermodesulfobacteriota bacterium]
MSKPSVMYPGPGCVVEFLHGNRPHPAWVLEEQSGKFRLLTLGKREMKLPGARILPWFGPRYETGLSRQEILETLAKHQARREELTSRVDPLEIWDLAQGELASAQVGWFAGLLWDDPDPDRLAAVGRALLEQKTHFKFRPPEFEIHAAEKVEARLAELKAARKRDRITAQGQTFFQDLWKTRSKGETPATPLDEDVEEKLKILLFSMMAHTEDREEQALWSAVRRGLPDLPCLPLLLAQAWGLVPEHHNAFLDQEGYVWGDGWTEPFERAVRTQAEKFTSQDNGPEPVHYISIDSATTLDIDDAFSITPEQDDGYSLRLALACPALAWEFGSELDLAVRERASSLYLPEGTSHMLPEALGLEVYSLRQGETRPA